MKKIFPFLFVAGVLSLSFFVAAEAVVLDPPVKWTNIRDLINKLIDFIFYIAVAILPAVVMYGGFKIITAGDDQNKVTEGRKAIIYGGIGFLIMLLAKGAVAMIESIFLK